METERPIPFGLERRAWQETISNWAAKDRHLLVSPPTKDPAQSYTQVPGIQAENVQLPSSGLSAAQRTETLRRMLEYLKPQQDCFLGYQVNQALQYEDDLKSFMNVNINNIGDPFVGGNMTNNTKVIERAVLDYYASLWNAKWPHDPKDPDSYWGYVLSMGCTEGVIYGLWSGRDYLAGRRLLANPVFHDPVGKPAEEGAEAFHPVAFFSEDTHYSVLKTLNMLQIDTFYKLGMRNFRESCPLHEYRSQGTWPAYVPSKGGDAGVGTIDIEALAKLVEFFASRGYPILVNFNFGTTFKGAFDDVEAAGLALMPIFTKYGLDKRKVFFDPEDPTAYDERTGYWFFVDGALGAGYMPFLEMAHAAGKAEFCGPRFDFRLPFVHAIAMSGHKWFGTPWPSGIYMTRTRYQLFPPDAPEYLGSPDTTFAGSRNGFSSLLFWSYLSQNAYDDQVRKVLSAGEVTNYAYEKLLNLQEELSVDLWVTRSPLSFAVLFRKPSDEITFRYSLSCQTYQIQGESRTCAHIFMMEHVTPALIDRLVDDLREADAFFPPDPRKNT